MKNSILTLLSFLFIFNVLPIIHHMLVFLNFDVKSIQLLQWLLTIIYGLLVFLWTVAFVECFKFYHWTSHLFFDDTWHSWERDWIWCKIKILWYHWYACWCCIYGYERIEMVIGIVGKDIGRLIASYWPTCDLQRSLEKYEQENTWLQKIPRKLVLNNENCSCITW